MDFVAALGERRWMLDRATGGRGPPLEIQEIFQQVFAVLGEDGLRVELDAVDRVVFVHEAHDLAFLGPGGDFQAVGQGLALDGRAWARNSGNWR